MKITRDADGLITQVVDNSGTSTMTYYPSTWVKTVTNGANKTVTYQYNGVGDVSTMTTPGSLNFTYSYNARNQVSSIANPNSVTVSFTYDNGGRRTRVDRPGGYTLYTYNARDWVYYVYNRNSSGADKYKVKYYWDNMGNVTKKAEWFQPASSTDYYWTFYSLDGVYRLTREARRHRDASTYEYDYRYGYDAVGNRTTEQELIAAWTRYYTYDNNDKLTKMGTTSGGNNLATFGYDSNGNMTSVAGSLYGSKTLVYNDENRLTSIAYGGVTDLYYYNWQGQRYRARLNGTYWRYVYNGDRVLEETNNSGTVLARYTTESGSYYEPLHHMWRSSSISRFPLYDAIGTARMLVDAAGTVTDSYHLDAWGQQLGTSGSTPNPYRYGGAWGYITDPSGMLQLGARFYWPEVGRFVGRDPAKDGVNWYEYAEGNPLVSTDPSGKVWWNPWTWFRNRKRHRGTLGGPGSCIAAQTPEQRCKWELSDWHGVHVGHYDSRVCSCEYKCTDRGRVVKCRTISGWQVSDVVYASCYEFCKQMQPHPRTDDPPIVCASGYHGE